MDTFFDTHSGRLEEQQRQRKERAKQRLEKKKREREIQEQIAAERRQAQIRAHASHTASLAAAEAIAEAQAHPYLARLVAFPRDAAGDRVLLPPSALEALTKRDQAMPYFFRVSSLSVVGSGMVQEKEEDMDDVTVGEMMASAAAHDEDSSGGEEWERETHAGVLEFTAEEGTARLPRKVWERVAGGLQEGPVEVEVQYVRLRKGTFASLKPEDPAAFAAIADPQARLQAILMQTCSTLSIGDAIELQDGGSAHLVRVRELKPTSAVSLIDTDLSVDLQLPANFGDAIPGPESGAVAVGESVHGVLSAGSQASRKVLLTEQQSAAIRNGHSSVLVEVTVTNAARGADCDLFLSFSASEPNRHNYDKADAASYGSSSLRVIPEDASLLSNACFYVTVVSTAFTVEPIEYRLSVQLEEVVGASAVTGRSPAADCMAEEERKECGNCKQMVPALSYSRHTVFCQRNNVRCEVESCGRVMHRREAAQHFHCSVCSTVISSLDERQRHEQVFHSEKTCPQCGMEGIAGLEELKRHATSLKCPKRMLVCRFCGDLVESQGEADDQRDVYLWGLSRHEGMCGNRTAPCDVCGAAIRLKEMDLHMQLHRRGIENMAPPLQPAAPPEISTPLRLSSSPPEEDTFMEEGGGDARGQEETRVEGVECPVCSEVLPSLRTLNSHLDTVHMM